MKNEGDGGGVVGVVGAAEDESIPDTFDDTGPPPTAEVKLDSEAEVEEPQESEALWPWPDEAAETEAATRLRWRWPDEDVEAEVRTSRQILPCLESSHGLELESENEERNEEMDQTIEEIDSS